MTIIYDPSAHIRGRNETEHLKIDLVEIPITGGGSSVPKSLLDVEYDEVTSASGYIEVEVYPRNLTDRDTMVLTSSNEAVATIVGNRVTYVSDGTVTITARAAGYTGTTFRWTFTTQETVETQLTGYAAGSLGAHILAAMDTFIGGKAGNQSLQDYVTAISGTVDNPSITINPNLFTNAETWDWSGVSLWSSRQVDDRYKPCLVTSRHALVADHVGYRVGDKIVYREPDGVTYHTVTITGYQRLQGGGPEGGEPNPDIAVVYFDAPVTNCKPYKVMPAGWMTTYAPGLYNIYSGLPLDGMLPNLRFAMHQLDRSWGSTLQINGVWNVTGINNLPTGGTYNIRSSNPDPIYDPYLEFGIDEAIPGCSGGPTFLIINDEPVYLCSQKDNYSATDFAYYITEIESVMDSLASAAPGTWTLTHPDLAAFNTYSP